jgi:hypothetical protein
MLWKARYPEGLNDLQLEAVNRHRTATPKAVKLRLITVVEQNMAEFGHAPLDESALEQAELSERTVGSVPAKRDK